MFFDHIPPEAAFADLHKKEREEWEALVFLEELGILVLSHPPKVSTATRADDEEDSPELPKAA